MSGKRKLCCVCTHREITMVPWDMCLPCYRSYLYYADKSSKIGLIKWAAKRARRRSRK